MRRASLPALVLVALALSTPVRAQTAAAVGEVRSSAYGVRLAPALGGTALTFSLGGAGALLQNQAGTGIAAGLDLGLLGTVFENGVCGFKFPEGIIPRPTLVTNASGDASAHATVAPAAGIGGVGEQDVSVTDEPLVDASVVVADLNVRGAISLAGFHATSRAHNGDGNRPVGEATSTTDLSIAGLLELRGLRWEVAQDGTDPANSTGSFSVAGGSLLGVPIPAGMIDGLVPVLNGVLAPLGLSIELPRFERVEGTTPISRVTPLVLRFSGSPVLNAVLDPLLELTRELKEQLVDAIASSCLSSYGGLLADLALGLVIGTGNLDVLIGGVEVSTNDDQFEDPFGSGPNPRPEVAAPAAPSPGSPAPVVPSVAVPPAVGAPVAPPAAASTGDAGLIATICETVHPHRSPSCSDGAATVAGVVGVGIAVAFVVGDLVVRRRRRSEPA